MGDDRAKAGADLDRDLVRERVRGRLFGGAPSIGRFEVRDKLGEGAMGAVYRAFDPELEREVALKVVRSAALANATADDGRLVREAQAMARLAHPNVVTVHEVGRHEGGVFIAMELIAGPTLRTWLATRPGHEAVLETLLAAGRGLSAAHERGLIHRDFKPENVLLGEDGRPRVVDFGLVTITGAAGGPSPTGALATTTGGTPRYMSPEQLRGEYCDSLSDQFNFSATLFEALFGAPPFPEEADDARLEAMEAGALDVPARHPARDLLPVLARGLAAAPNARFPTMAALLAALEGVAEGRGKRRRLVGAGVALAMLAGVGAWLALRPAPVRPRPVPTAVRADGLPQGTYVELNRMLERGDFQGCIDATGRHEPTPHLLTLRLACAAKAKRLDLVRSTCKTYRASFTHEEVPALCTDTYARAKEHFERGEYTACIDVGEKGKPDLMVVMQMYLCAAKLRDPAVYRRVCKHASTHFPDQHPPEECPKP